MLLWIVFGVSGIVPEASKNACFFPQMFGLLWGCLFFLFWVLKV